MYVLIGQENERKLESFTEEDDDNEQRWIEFYSVLMLHGDFTRYNKYFKASLGGLRNVV